MFLGLSDSLSKSPERIPALSVLQTWEGSAATLSCSTVFFSYDSYNLVEFMSKCPDIGFYGRELQLKVLEF
jgi:hypothetical protein